MKFQFRFQKVLEQRQRVEDEARRDFLTAKAKTEAALAELKRLYQSIDDARAQAQASHLAPQLVEISLFIEGQKIRIASQHKVVREFKEAEEVVQDRLVEAAKDKKTLEKLREKDLQAYRERLDKQERDENDDLSTMRFGRGEGP